MADASSVDPVKSITETVTEEEQRNPTLHLKLRKPKVDKDKKVQWTTGTIDNEHMNKKKSKCCCVYEKPKLFGESSSENDDDETESCQGHKHKCYRHFGSDGHQPSSSSHGHDGGEAGPSGSNGGGPSR